MNSFFAGRGGVIPSTNLKLCFGLKVNKNLNKPMKVNKIKCWKRIWQPNLSSAYRGRNFRILFFRRKRVRSATMGIRCQFHQHFTTGVIVQMFCAQLLFTYILGWFVLFFGARILAQKPRVKCRWNWLNEGVVYALSVECFIEDNSRFWKKKEEIAFISHFVRSRDVLKEIEWAI